MNRKLLLLAIIAYQNILTGALNAARMNPEPSKKVKFSKNGQLFGTAHSMLFCGGKCVEAGCRAYSFDSATKKCSFYFPENKSSVGHLTMKKSTEETKGIWTIANFHEKDDECRSNPCKNGGLCIDGEAKYYCVCFPRFFGESCQNVDSQIVMDFCASKNGFYCKEPTSCFVRYTEPKSSNEESHNTCVSAAKSVRGVRGRLAVIPTESVFNQIKANVSGFDDTGAQTWVALKTRVPGSNNLTDWWWFDGNNPAVPHLYGHALFNNRDDDCAIYEADMRKPPGYHDQSCASKKHALCEFLLGKTFVIDFAHKGIPEFSDNKPTK